MTFHHFPPGTEQYIAHPSHAKPGIHTLPNRLMVLTMLENPLRWRSRYANYWAFEAMCRGAGVDLYTVEVAFGEREFEVTQAGNPFHLQLRTKCEMWHKENALNVLATRLPLPVKPGVEQYIAWIDSDVEFVRRDWAQETLHLLQHYDVIQMFSEVHNLGPQYTTLTSRGSFMWNYVENRQPPHHPDFAKKDMRVGKASGYYAAVTGKWHHTGFAWACRRSAWDKMGGLLDFAILGSGDYHMAAALVNQIEISLNHQFPKRYTELCYQWQDRIATIRNNPNGGVGYMPGTVLHRFHGTTANRSYKDRWKLLARTNFDPDVDLYRDVQGLWQLSGRSQELRDGLRAYNRMRDEDSPSVQGML